MSRTVTLVARNVMWLAGGEVTLKGGLLLAGVVIARGMGPDAMGVFTVAWGASLVLMQILAAGQPQVLIRETARFPENGPDLHIVAREYQNRLAWAVVPIAGALALAVPQPSLRWALLSFVLYAFFRSRLVTGGSVFKGLDRMEMEVVARTLELALALALLVLASVAGAPAWTSGIAFTVGGVAGSAWIVSRVRTLPGGGGSPLPRAVMVREGLPFLGLTTVSLLVSRADAFLMATLGVSDTDIGHYGVAIAPVLAVFGLLQVVGLGIYPSLSRASAQGGLRLRWIVAAGAAGAAAGIVLATVLYLVREPMVSILFGREYGSSVRLLATLVWGLPGAGAATVLGAVVAAMRRQSWSLISETTVLAVVVTGLVMAIPRWGVQGAASVMVCGQWLLGVGGFVVALLAVWRPSRDEG